MSSPPGISRAHVSFLIVFLFFFTFIIILQQKWEKKARPAKGHFPLISFSKKKYIIEPSEKWKAQTTVIRHSVLCLSPPCSPSCRCCLISSSNQATSSLLLSSFSSTTRTHTQKGGYSHHTHTHRANANGKPAAYNHRHFRQVPRCKNRDARADCVYIKSYSFFPVKIY